jgi:hypothetical protein
MDADEFVGIWGGGDVQELADQFVEVTYGADFSASEFSIVMPKTSSVRMTSSTMSKPMVGC